MPAPSARRWATDVAGLAVGLLLTTTAATAAPAPPPPPASPCEPGVRACVQLGAGTAWLLAPDGVVIRGPVPMSPGAPGMETPTGRFSVQWKNADHVSSFGDVPMPWSVFFDDRGRAFHGGDLDRRSRGCVRLTDEDARVFFDVLQPRDAVQVLP